MNSNRIKEIQETTAYPESVSVHEALLQVWNECEQELKSEVPIDQPSVFLIHKDGNNTRLYKNGVKVSPEKFTEYYGCKMTEEQKQILKIAKEQYLIGLQSEVPIREEIKDINFIKWYSGMDEKKIRNAFERYKKETNQK